MSDQKQQQNHQSAQSSARRSTGEFDFDVWAIQVRRQMMAALKRRGSA